MTKKYADWLDDVNEGHPKKKTNAEAMKIVYDNAKNHFLEWAGDNLAAKASVNAYFDDYFNAKTLKERQKIWSLIESSKYYDSLKNPQGSVNKNIKDWEAERRKSKQNKIKEEKKEQSHKYKGPYALKPGQNLFSERWKGFDPKTMSKSNLTDTIDQYLDDRLIEMEYLPRVPFAKQPENVKYLDIHGKERLPKDITGDPIANIFPDQLKELNEALLGKLTRMTPSERYNVFSNRPELEVAYRNYLNNKEILGNPTSEQQAEQLAARAASSNARLESEATASKSEPIKEDKKEQAKETAKKEEAAQESIARGNNEQQQAEEASKPLNLGNFFDYTNPYFQYYTAPTALGLGLGGLLGGWKGSLLGAAGGAGLGALAKYLVDNDKIHMA